MPTPVTITHPHQEYPITVQMDGRRLVVSYGADVTRCETYEQTAKALGMALMHSLSCINAVPDYMIRKALVE